VTAQAVVATVPQPLPQTLKRNLRQTGFREESNGCATTRGVIAEILSRSTRRSRRSPQLDFRFIQNSSAVLKPMRATNCTQIRRLPVATHVLGTDIDDPNGRGDRFSHVLVRRCRSIVVGILSRVAHLTHPFKLAQRTVVDEARCRDPGLAMSSADGSDTESFGSKSRDERFTHNRARL